MINSETEVGKKCNACNIYPSTTGTKCKSCSGLLNHSFSEYKKSARRSGQTTRLIDESIQYLFEKGELFLIRKQGISKAQAIVKDKKGVFIDPDHSGTNMAQNNFIFRILKRLEAEHKNCYTTNMQYGNCIHIKVKNK